MDDHNKVTVILNPLNVPLKMKPLSLQQLFLIVLVCVQYIKSLLSSQYKFSYRIFSVIITAIPRKKNDKATYKQRSDLYNFRVYSLYYLCRSLENGETLGGKQCSKSCRGGEVPTPVYRATSLSEYVHI